MGFSRAYVLGLDHVVLNTSDAKEMLIFYCDVLGCKLEREVESIGLFQLRAGDSLIDIMENDSYQPAEQKNMNHFCLRISPLDPETIKRHLAKHKIEIVGEGTRYGAEGHGRSIYVKDPEGNEVELKESG